MGELAAFVLTSALGAGVPWLVISRDRAKLRARGDEHPWNVATFACAVVFFGPFAIAAHYFALRRNWVALAWLVGVLAAMAATAAVG